MWQRSTFPTSRGASGLGGDPLSHGMRGFEVGVRRACGGGIPPTAAGINYVRDLTWTIDFYFRCDWLNLSWPFDHGEY